MKIGGFDWTDLTEDFGYWTVEVDDIDDYIPSQIIDSPSDNNPFMGWEISGDVISFIEDTMRTMSIPDDVRTGVVHFWGNYFDRSNYTCHKYHHVPHIDGPGWVGNLWLSDHPEGSRGTQFYNYNDDWKNDEFHFPGPVDLLDEIETTWEQWDISMIESYGFNYLGTAPCKKNTITIYNSCMPHLAYIGDEVDKSWTQLVKIEKVIPPKYYTTKVFSL
jgi:hypothetical protein